MLFQHQHSLSWREGKKRGESGRRRRRRRGKGKGKGKGRGTDFGEKAGTHECTDPTSYFFFFFSGC